MKKILDIKPRPLTFYPNKNIKRLNELILNQYENF